MAIGLVVVSNQNQTILMATWPRIGQDFMTLLGLLLAALLAPALAMLADVALFVPLGTIALPIAVAALVVCLGLALMEVWRDD